MSDLLARLRHHHEALAALVAYGNGSGTRAAYQRAQLVELLDVVPGETERLRAEATALDEAGAEHRAAELRAVADELASVEHALLHGSTPPVRPQPRRTRKGARS